MPAGLVDVPVLDGAGNAIAHFKAWSSDGTLTGQIFPIAGLFDLVNGAAVDLSVSSTPGVPGGGIQSVQGAGVTMFPVSTVNLPRANANGATVSRVVSNASAPAGVVLKASAGNIINIDLFNIAAYDVFVKLYDRTTAPNLASDTPRWTIPLKAGTGFSREFVQGRSFANGIVYVITKLQADTDTTAVAAGDVTGTIDWI
jgi:hypothetical protein